MIVQYQLLSRGLPLSFEFNICSLYLRCQICQFEALGVHRANDNNCFCFVAHQ